MYLVELTPAEIWIGIAIIAVIAIVAVAWKHRSEREWEEHLRQKDEDAAQFKEFFARYKKDHPEIWDENGNLHGSPKTKD